MPKANPNSQASRRSLCLILRAVGAFALLGLLLVVLYWWGFHSYPDVAEWVQPGSHEAFIYEGETYYLSGQIGKKGLTKSKYPMDKLLGQIKDNGIPVTTSPETTAEPETEFAPDPEETESSAETETTLESVKPPIGADLFDGKKHTYVLYAVEKKEEYLILAEEDGAYYLYYREGPDDPAAAN